MVHYRLHYFDVYGRAETIRMMFTLADVPFDDRRISFDEWETVKEEPIFIFGQGPILEVDGKPLAQSNAIFRYVGNKYGFAGNSDFEKAQVDSIADRFQDFYDDIRPFYAVACGVWEGDKEELKNSVMIPVRDQMLSEMTKFIENNSTASGYLVGESLTYADLLLFNHIVIYEGYVPGYADDFPKVKQLCAQIRQIPRMKDYLKNRPHRIR